MLKSTYKAPEGKNLPPGWTEHKAPTGHTYYYNSETKQSTYTRPTPPSNPEPLNFGPNSSNLGHDPLNLGPNPSNFGNPSTSGTYRQSGDFRGGKSYQRRKDNDRPKSKKPIPGVEPWVLVKTKYGRRFVYHPERNESLWKFPQDVLLAVIKLDEMERQEREGKLDRPEESKLEAGEEKAMEAGEEKAMEIGEKSSDKNPGPADQQQEDMDSDYEEVEVTDDEDHDIKRQRVESEQPMDFDEDDIEYQLAAMGEDYDLDPEDYQNGLSKEDSVALFQDLLDDFRINPYTTWEKVIEEGHIIEDDRYTLLPNMKARKDVFTEWSTARIQELKERRLKEEKRDPKIGYLRFLQENATPKLYWPEFKRKFKKEPEMKDIKLDDKTREKLYRDHISRLKLSETQRKQDLSALLKSVPIDRTLPSAVLTDLRYISLPVKVRDSLVEAYLQTMPEVSEERNPEREKREKAMANRERIVQEERKKQEKAKRYGREMLREEEEELDRAMNVGSGIRGYQ